MNPLHLLAWALLAALGAVGLTVLVRNAPGVSGLVMEARKPWACNVCMSFWSSLIVVPLLAVVLRDGRYLGLFLAVFALTLGVLERMSRPPGPPSIPAEFFNE